MTETSSYADRFESARVSLDDGVLEVTLHTNGTELLWGGPPHEELGELFTCIANDRDVRVVIITGTGDWFVRLGPAGPVSTPIPADRWFDIARSGMKLVNSHLAIEVPMIAAVNGHCRTHSELALLCDIVIASDRADFQDEPHIPRGIVPGDGMHVVMPAILGLNRARYFLLTGQRLTATEALAAGMVGEVVPHEELMDRARGLARQLLLVPNDTLRYTRALLTRNIRMAAAQDLSYGFALEGLGAATFWPGQNRPVWPDLPE